MEPQCLKSLLFEADKEWSKIVTIINISIMVKLLTFAVILSSVPAVMGVSGWFKNVPRGGTNLSYGLYPDALTNVVHGHGDARIAKNTDDKINAILEVKSTSTEKESLFSDEEYDEDPFFHALLHNNDDGSRAVKNSSTSPEEELCSAMVYIQMP
mmetsp:Transcript_24915/g.59988  ORF Transcript_24915/g.59988 Transcript_24915/m.59988 type:complete len:155 (-) Transcript_24915:461-925(-)